MAARTAGIPPSQGASPSTTLAPAPASGQPPRTPHFGPPGPRVARHRLAGRGDGRAGCPRLPPNDRKAAAKPSGQDQTAEPGRARRGGQPGRLTQAGRREMCPRHTRPPSICFLTTRTRTDVVFVAGGEPKIWALAADRTDGVNRTNVSQFSRNEKAGEIDRALTVLVDAGGLEHRTVVADRGGRLLFGCRSFEHPDMNPKRIYEHPITTRRTCRTGCGQPIHARPPSFIVWVIGGTLLMKVRHPFEIARRLRSPFRPATAATAKSTLRLANRASRSERAVPRYPGP
jgi:hypothetical protein